MPRDQLPAGVQRLLDERAEARAARDWQRADALREELAALGWEPQDGPSGSTARPILAESIADAGTPLVSTSPPWSRHQSSWSPTRMPMTWHAAWAAWRHTRRRRPGSWSSSPTPAPFDVDAALAAAGLPIEPVVVRSESELGWAGSRTLGLRQSRGEISILLDTSLEPTGDFVTPLARVRSTTSGSASPAGGA